MAGRYTINVDQGATLTVPMTAADENGTPINLTGRTARMQVRPTLESTTVTVELTTANGRIALGGTAGTITLTLPDSVTSGIAAGTYVYDLELVGATVDRLMQGDFIVHREVTR